MNNYNMYTLLQNLFGMNRMLNPNSNTGSGASRNPSVSTDFPIDIIMNNFSQEQPKPENSKTDAQKSIEETTNKGSDKPITSNAESVEIVGEKSSADETIINENATNENIVSRHIANRNIPNKNIINGNIVNENIVNESTTNKSTTNKSATNKSATSKSTISKSIAEENTASKSIAEENVPGKSIAEENVPGKSIADENVANENTAAGSVLSEAMQSDTVINDIRSEESMTNEQGTVNGHHKPKNHANGHHKQNKQKPWDCADVYCPLKPWDCIDDPESAMPCGCQDNMLPAPGPGDCLDNSGSISSDCNNNCPSIPGDCNIIDPSVPGDCNNNDPSIPGDCNNNCPSVPDDCNNNGSSTPGSCQNNDCSISANCQDCREKARDIFASFSCREQTLPESTNLPLKALIPDITGSIRPCGSYTLILKKGYYSVYYFISVEMKSPGFIRAIPVFNDCIQKNYMGCGISEQCSEKVDISRYFITEITEDSPLLFLWHSSESVSIINMNIEIQKLFR